MLTVLADGSKLPPYVIVHCRILRREELLRGSLSDANLLVGLPVSLVWNRWPGVLLRIQGMLVLDAFKG